EDAHEPVAAGRRRGRGGTRGQRAPPGRVRRAPAAAAARRAHPAGARGRRARARRRPARPHPAPARGPAGRRARHGPGGGAVQGVVAGRGAGRR
ncbi:MAG: hypothetical protein AVDCRST_MAG54-789, partial [uncultured Actinomycetospora sp.]